MTAIFVTARTRVIAVFSVVRIWTNIFTKKSKIPWATVVPKQYKFYFDNNTVSYPEAVRILQ